MVWKTPKIVRNDSKWSVKLVWRTESILNQTGRILNHLSQRMVAWITAIHQKFSRYLLA